MRIEKNVGIAVNDRTILRTNLYRPAEEGRYVLPTFTSCLYKTPLKQFGDSHPNLVRRAGLIQQAIGYRSVSWTSFGLSTSESLRSRMSNCSLLETSMKRTFLRVFRSFHWTNAAKRACMVGVLE